MPFVNRPPAEPLESLESLMARAYMHNHGAPLLPALSAKGAFGLPPNCHLNLMRAPDHVRRVMDLLTLTADEVLQLTLHRFVPGLYPLEAFAELPRLQFGPDAPLWEARRLNTYVVGGLARRVCPACCGDQPILRLPWSLRPITVCPLHSTLLVDHCTGCGQPLRVDLTAGCCACCRVPLGALRAYTLDGDAASLGVTHLLWDALGCLLGADGLATTGLPPDHPLCRLPSAALFDLFWALGQLLFTRDPENPVFAWEKWADGRPTRPQALMRQLSVARVHSVLVTVWTALEGWPESWYEMLERFAEREVQQERQEPWHRPLPSEIKRRLRGPAFAFLHEAWAPFVEHQRAAGGRLHYPWLHVVRHQERLATQGVPERQQGDGSTMLTLKEVARTLGMNEASVRAYLASGDLRLLAHPPDTTRRRIIYIDPVSVRELRACRAAVLTLSQAAAHCGTTADGVLALVEAGLVPATRHRHAGQSMWGFMAADLDAALVRLIGAVPMRPAPPPTATGAERTLTVKQMQGVVSGASLRLPDLLVAIRDGVLPAQRVRRTLEVSSLRVALADALAFQAARRRAQGTGYLALEDVRQRLECSPETLRRLDAAGLLMPREKLRKGGKDFWRYAPEDIVTFKACYVTADEAAAILGCSPMTVQVWARASRLPAISGLQIDGSRAYRFEKARLVAWRKRVLPRTTAMAMLGVHSTTIYRWMREGRLTPVDGPFGRGPWFAWAEVEKLAEARRSGRHWSVALRT
jgi:predicted site-specific integrase-resolvase